ncbi:MAG: AAA family ATPase, partial [Nitrosomonadaceae bacterium]
FLNIAIKLSTTVGEVHQSGIIHKDINPKNIIVNLDTDQLNLIDFSISSHLPSETQKISHPNALEGTLAYMSPEQTGRMNRAIDYRTDFYSLGVTFYEMLTRKLPFQVDDAMELVHCHIAKQPLTPIKVDPEIPKALSNIVMKLLEKTADKRYQSAYGIQADLDTCLKQLRDSGKIEKFTLGLQDVMDQFHIPQKLYGREQEIATLMTEFDRISQRQTELLLVSGYSGIGKSALVYEIHKPIVEKRGYFISGKFDQLQRTIPYNAIVAAFRELMRQFLTESEDRLKEWKEKLLTALGVNGQVIIDVIPEVELIVGPQPDVAELAPQEAQNRFNLVFQRFIQVFCQREHPLVIFLDDLQWADPASLKLIELMMTDTETSFVLLIGAYRDNEVSASHPLMLTIEKLQNVQAPIKSISLAPLNFESLTQFLAETLYRDRESIKPLVELTERKTDGNPFFVRQFLFTLYREKLLQFDKKHRCWDWEIDRIEAMNITNNVVDLLIRRVQKLPESTQKALRLAACVGNRFDLNTLSIIYQQSAEDTSRHLSSALEEGLIMWISESEEQSVIFKFLHDRVQQAAYSLIDESQKKAVHLSIGRQLLANMDEAEQAERIFELVDHLNVGRDLVTNEKEKVELAKLNLEAGIKAKASTAYAAAREYLIASIDCIPTNMWVDYYEQTFTMHTHLAEVEYLNGNFEKSEELIELLLNHAKSDIEKAEVYNTLITQFTLVAKYQDVLQAGRKALSLLGMDLPEDDLERAFEIDLTTCRKNMRDRDIASLLDEPEMTLTEKKVALRLLSNLIPVSVITNRKLLAVVTVRMVNLSLRYGHTPDSSTGYSFYGMLLCSVLGNYKSGYDFGMLAIKLSDKFNNAKEKCKTSHVFATYINHWSKHIKLAELFYDQGFHAGLESGELQYSGYHCYNKALRSYYQSQPLSDLIPKLIELLKFTQKTKNQHATDIITAVQLAVLNLTGRTTGKCDFHNEMFSDAQYQENCQAGQSFFALGQYKILKAQVLYLYGQLDDALNYILSADKMLSYVAGTIAVAARNFCHSLVLTARYPEVARKTQKQYLAQLETNQEQMKVWAENCPEGFHHKYFLVAAEMARITSKEWEAADLYDQAIESAGKNEFIQDEALANELAAKFYLAKNRETLAKVYLFAAHYCYQKWGATMKVKDLEESFPQYLAETSMKTRSPAMATLTDESSTGTGSEVLDLRTVMKAAQAISGEIVLETLLEKLMRIALENAGAQKGFLILEKEDKLFIEAEGLVDKDEITVMQSTPVEANAHPPLLPPTIINYVKRTKENIVITDAKQNSQFSNDPYIAQNNPKSIFCIPIVKQQKLVGLLYLENNLTTDAFTPDRIEIMQVLSSQAAISLENALLYEEVRQEVADRRTAEEEVRRLNAELEQRVAERTAELEAFSYSVSHDLRAPVRHVTGFAHLLQQHAASTMDEEARRYVGIISEAAQHMGQLIDDLPEFARTGRGELKKTVVELEDLVQEACQDCLQEEP